MSAYSLDRDFVHGCHHLIRKMTKTGYDISRNHIRIQSLKTSYFFAGLPQFVNTGNFFDRARSQEILLTERFDSLECDPVVQNHIRLSLIHISEPTRLGMISYAVFC